MRGSDGFLRSNVALVDLSTDSVKIKETLPQVVRAYLGGRGLNMYYLNKYLKPEADPFSPENVLIFGPGLLTGTGAPNTGRFNISARSPESGVLGDSNIGGFFGPEMRYAGIDRLLITGRAGRPCYIYIEDGRVEVRDATDYWGLNTVAVQKRFREELGNDIEVATIGEAGERMVRFANVITGVKNAAGRCGMGAVMGSKNLKAVVARGTGGIPIKEPRAFVERIIEYTDYLKKSKVIQVLGRVGTPFLYEVSNYLGAIRTHNSQLNAFEDTLDAEVIHEYVEKMISCFACVVHCRHRNTIGGEGPEYTTIGLLGANVGVAPADKVIELNNLANDLGLDVSSTGTIIAWAIELYQRGLIDQEFTGRALTFGDYDLVRDLMLDISKRRGFGDVLAESTKAVARFGERSRDYLIAIKDLPQSDPHDCRYIKSFALGIATASRGADHLRSRPTLDILDLPQEVTLPLYGVPTDPSPISYETKEFMVFAHENIYAVVDSVGICKFICRGFNSPKLFGYEHYSELIRTATGLALSEDDLIEVGRRIVDLERMINTRLGVSRAHDTLPRRYFDEPMPLRRAQGHYIDREKFDMMLSRYYALRGWDQEGVPRRERIEELEAIG